MPVAYKKVATDVPPAIRQRFDDLADITGLSPSEILRHIVHYGLDHIESKLRSGEIPPDPYKTKPLKTPKPRPAYVPPQKTLLDSPPSLLKLIQTGVVPDVDPIWMPDWDVPVDEDVSTPLPASPPTQEPEPIVDQTPARPRRRSG